MGLLSALKMFASVGRLHICMVGGFGSLVFAHLLAGGYWPLLALIVTNDWFLINILNRVADIQEDIKNKIPYSESAFKNRKWIYGLYLFLLISTLSLHWVWLPELFWARFCGNFLGLAYNFRSPFLAGRRLKELYFFKNMASCSGFLLTLFVYPLTSGIPLLPVVKENPLYVLLLVGFFALFEISFEIIYDLRDYEGDRALSIQTYPVAHGIPIAEGLVVLLNVFSITFLIIGAELGLFTGRETMMVHAPLIQLGIFFYARSNNYRPSDVILLTWSFVGMLGWYCFWDIIGMPQDFYVSITVVRVINASMVAIGFMTWYWNKELYGSSTIFWLNYFAIGVGGWVCENSAIEWYDYYHYSPDTWTLYLGHMPIEVCIIWPQVIFGVRRLLRTRISGLKLVLIGSVEIFFQALFIEICNVQAGLWSWSQSNIFGVPIVGVLGWAAFGGAALFCLEVQESALQKPWKNDFVSLFKRHMWLMIPVLSMISVHATLIVSWKYLGFEWLSAIDFDPANCVVGAFALVSLAMILFTYLHFTTQFRIRPSEEIPRLVAASVLMWELLHLRPSWELLIFSVTMSGPYMFQTTLHSIEYVISAQRKHNATFVSDPKKIK